MGSFSKGHSLSVPVFSLLPRNPELMGSGGSTAARLKLKGIDGMTPQDVEYAV